MNIDLTQWNENRFIAAHIIGGSSNDDSKRKIGYPLWEKGWTGYVRDNVQRTLDAGFKRISLHNPGGTLSGEEMKPDQFIDAANAGLKWITADFKSAWKPVTSQGIEVICYLGALKLSEKFKSYLYPTKFDSYLNRIYNSYKYPLDAGMTIAFDALFDVSADDPVFAVYELFSKFPGLRTYVEPTPHKNNPHLFKANFIITEQLYKHRSTDWIAPDEVLTGEKIRLLNQPFGPVTNTWQNEIEWRASWVADCKKNNYSCMIGPWEMLRDGTKVSDLLAVPPTT